MRDSRRRPMFLHLLSKSEKTAFAKAAELVIVSDAVLHELELELRASLAEDLDITWPESVPEWEAVRDALRSVTPAVSKRIILLELCGVACADLDLHEDEVALLREVAEALDLEPEVLDACLDLAPRAHSIRAEAENLILTPPASVST